MRNQTATQLLFEMSHAGRGTVVFPESDVPDVNSIPALEDRFLAKENLPLPEIAEPDVVRHFVNLSTLNMSVDSHFYPLGSCTMKYNPKRHERLARLPQAAENSHPYRPESQIQGLSVFCTKCGRCCGDLRPCRAFLFTPLRALG
ncbi:MAG: hypothetical protein U0936_01870 [Planctomycetaceae bacterium]